MALHQLSGLDALFLHLETPQMPMHVGALHVFDLPGDYRGSFVTDMRRHLRSRLPLAPALRRRLAPMPLNLANPAWVEAAPDLDWHVVGVTLPPGSGLAALEDAVGRLHPQLLDRARPLWRFFVFDGLVPGPHGTRRFGMYTQLHHAAVDGQAAVALAQAMLDPTPDARPVVPARVRHEPARLGVADLLRAAVQQQARQIGRWAKALPGAVGTMASLAQAELGESAARATSGRGASPAVRNFALAPRLPTNAPVSSRRVFAATRLLLADLKTARQRHGLTLNDAVLLVCSGALRRFFGRRKALPRKSMIAAVPISLRAAGDTAANNQASMTLVSLGTHLADPHRRMAHIRAATASMKATVASDRVKALLPTDYPSIGVPWLVEGAVRAAGRAVGRLPAVANLVISNVPGPTVPLYMAGARMVTNFPASIVVHGVALNVTVQTYDDALDIGLMACADALPDVRELGADLVAAFDELRSLVPRAIALS
jgi:diacylglycerol O-acyltransferase / wax synthase